jgi:CheY-like chemotaxis protein
MIPQLNCVLLIDDDEPTNYYNQLVIQQSGCTRHVMATQSAQEALRYLAETAEQVEKPLPDLIFLDINMPAMDGWEFLNEYKQLRGPSKGLIVVMLTTSIFPEDKIRASAIPEVVCFENKPLTLAKVQAIVENHFSLEGR